MKQSIEKNFTSIESKNKDKKQNDKKNTHYDKQTSNITAKAVILKKTIKRNFEKFITFFIVSKTITRKSRKRKIHETKKDIVKRLKLTDVSFDYTSILLIKMSI